MNYIRNSIAYAFWVHDYNRSGEKAPECCTNRFAIVCLHHSAESDIYFATICSIEKQQNIRFRVLYNVYTSDANSKPIRLNVGNFECQMARHWKICNVTLVALPPCATIKAQEQCVHYYGNCQYDDLVFFFKVDVCSNLLKLERILFLSF